MLTDLQRRIYQNKLSKGFNTAADEQGLNREISCLAEELGELARSHRRGDRDGVVDAVTDLIVYCLGMYEILGVDGDKEVERVLRDIEGREYVSGPSGFMRRAVEPALPGGKL
jgi:NTP pyrophosphatase (non-canonical NTP hydrolase)